MSIRRVGGPKGPRSASSTPPASVRGTGPDFSATLGAQKVSATLPVAGADLLAQVRSGEITREGYVTARVQEATAHLAGVPAEQLESIQRDLRERCEADPLLKELVERATS